MCFSNHQIYMFCKFESTINLPVRTILFCSAVFGVTSSLAVIHTIHGRPWMCIARDRAWSVSRCTQSRTTVTVYSHGQPWLCTARRAWSSNTRSKHSRSLSAKYKPGCSSYWSQSQIFVYNRDFSLPHLRIRGETSTSPGKRQRRQLQLS